MQKQTIQNAKFTNFHFDFFSVFKGYNDKWRKNGGKNLCICEKITFLLEIAPKNEEKRSFLTVFHKKCGAGDGSRTRREQLGKLPPYR